MNPLFIPHAANERRTRWRPAHYLAQLAAAEVSRDESGVTYDLDKPPFAPLPRQDGSTPAPRHERAAQGSGALPRIRVVEPIEVRGPALWAKLHKRPLEWPGGDDKEWLKQFSRDVGCGSCASHWRAWVQLNPPDFTSARAYADWTRRGHNHVNRTLGRAEWTWEEFGRAWGY